MYSIVEFTIRMDILGVTNNLSHYNAAAWAIATLSYFVDSLAIVIFHGLPPYAFYTWTWPGHILSNQDRTGHSPGIGHIACLLLPRGAGPPGIHTRHCNCICLSWLSPSVAGALSGGLVQSLSAHWTALTVCTWLDFSIPAAGARAVGICIIVVFRICRIENFPSFFVIHRPFSFAPAVSARRLGYLIHSIKSFSCSLVPAPRYEQFLCILHVHQDCRDFRVRKFLPWLQPLPHRLQYQDRITHL